MTAVALVVFLIAALGGCTQPLSKAELFPERLRDGRAGIILIQGEPAANLVFQDQAGREVEKWGERGASPALTIGGQTPTRFYFHALPPGNYRVEVWPFYYRLTIVGRIRKDLPMMTTGATVTSNPSGCYEPRTARHYGWCLYIYTGTIPHGEPGAIDSPRVQVTGSGLIEDVLNFLRR